MEQLTSQLHLFYKHSLQPQQRHQIHNFLISTLTSPQYQTLAQNALTNLTNPDPYLLFHALTILQHAPTTEPLVHILLSHIPHTPRETLNKAASVTAYHGLILWSTNPLQDFLQSVLPLVYHNGHTPDAIRNISAGVVLLTSLIELLYTRHKFTSKAKTFLCTRIRERSNDVLSGLEIGARLAGPQFPDTVRLASVRAISQFVTLSPNAVPDVVGVLSRCVDGRYDQTGAEILTVIIDILNGRVRHIQPVIVMASTALEAIAMGTTAVQDFASRITLVVEIIVRRCTVAGDYDTLERILNGLMGVTGLWATNEPSWMVGVLNGWNTVLEAFENADMHGELVSKVHAALAKVCVERCMDNPTLTHVEQEDVQYLLHDWENLYYVADIATDPVTLSASLFVQQADDNFSWGFEETCTRTEYVSKCIDTLLTIARFSNEVAVETVKFAITKLGDTQHPQNMIAAAEIAFGLTCIHKSPELLQRVYELLVAGFWKEPKLAVPLFRTAAALVRLLEDEPEEMIRNVGGRLLAVCQEALLSNIHFLIQYGAMVLSLSLSESFRELLFPRPPLPASLIMTTPYPAVTAIGVTSTLYWALFPPRGKDRRIKKWDEAEWTRRISTVREILRPIFTPSGGLPGMKRYGYLVEAAMEVTYGAHPDSVKAIWSALSQDVIRVLTTSIGELCDVMAGVQANEREEVCFTLTKVLDSLHKVKKAHRSLAGGWDGIIDRVLPHADAHDRLMDVCLRILVDIIENEGVRADAIAVARTALTMPGGTGETGVAVLYAAATASFDGVVGLIEAVSSRELRVCQEALQALQKVQVRRRIFGRREFVPLREGLVRECLGIVGLVPGRESLGDEALEVLWEIRKSDDGTFERVLKEVGDVGHGWDSRNEFGVGVRQIVDDYCVRNAKLSLQ